MCSINRKFVVLMFMASSSLAAEANVEDLMRMSERLDAIEKEELVEITRKIDICLVGDDFECAEGLMKKAGKTATAQESKRMVLEAKSKIVLARRDFDARQREKAEAERKEQERIRALAEMQAKEEERIRQELAEAERAAERAAKQERQREERAEQRRSDQERDRAIYNAITSAGRDIRNMNMQLNAQMAQAVAQTNDALQERREREEARQREQREAQAQARLEASRRKYAQEKRALEQAQAERQKQEQLAKQKKAEQAAKAAEEARARQAAQEKAERLASQQAEEQARVQAEKDRQQAKERYLQAVRNGMRMAAKKCYGDIYVGGQKPDVRSEISCIDVEFRYWCRGTPQNMRTGGMTNFVNNMGGCFGDIKKLDPKPSCEAEDLVVEATTITGCR